MIMLVVFYKLLLKIDNRKAKSSLLIFPIELEKAVSVSGAVKAGEIL